MKRYFIHKNGFIKYSNSGDDTLFISIEDNKFISHLKDGRQIVWRGGNEKTVLNNIRLEKTVLNNIRLGSCPWREIKEEELVLII